MRDQAHPPRPSEQPNDNAECLEWINRLKDVPVLHEDLLYIVLNYLCVIGCHEGAEELAKESGAIPEMPLRSIQLRRHIYSAIINGRIYEAVEDLNLIDHLILQTNPETNFKLKQQQLMKIIEQRDDEEALSFAQRELAPCVKEHPHLLPQLEEAMTRLAFPDIPTGAVAESISEREETARTVDDAVLTFYGVARESVLECLLKNLIWTQSQILEATSDMNQKNRVPPIPFLMSPTIAGFVAPPLLPKSEQNPASAESDSSDEESGSASPNPTGEFES